MATTVHTATRNKSTEQTSIAEGVVQNQLDRLTEVYRVTGAANQAAALSAPDIPEKGDFHPTDTQQVCRRLRVSALAPTTWEVEAEYEFIGYATGQALEGLPPPAVLWTTQLVEEASFFDANDQPILLPSGEPLDTPPSKVYPIVTLQYEFSSLTFTASVGFTHGGRVNGSQWSTFTTGTIPAKCAMLRGVQCQKVYGTQFNYFRVGYEIAFRSQFVESTERGWQLCLLNAGFSYKNAQGNLVSIVAADATIPKAPVLLNATGTQHALMPGVNITKNFIYKDLYKTADFSALGVI